jgi:fumarylacetoacetase
MLEPSQTDPNRPSWIDSANIPGNGFPLQSLPFCIFLEDGLRPRPRPGVGIGDQILDLHILLRSGLLGTQQPSLVAGCSARSLNLLISCGPAAHAALRACHTALLDESAEKSTRRTVRAALVPMSEATLLKPIHPPNYTDFYASINHARRVGQLFRPENPLLSNYKHLPIGYHARASSIVASGTPIRRPHGQSRPAEPDAAPTFAPARFLDYELEAALYITGGNPLGEPITIANAQDHVFGLSLLNDWSARDIQSWEYQPLGPFLGKSFATSVSPWVVPIAALAPFRVPAADRAPGDPAPLPYLFDETDQKAGALDLTLEALLLTPKMRAANQPPHRLSQTNLRHLYWTPAQLIAHHTSNGCNLASGDLLATGTVSGPDEDSAGCLLELTRNGARPIQLPNGETRTALEDGDEVILRGFCHREGFATVSLGECRGTVLPAVRNPGA